MTTESNKSVFAIVLAAGSATRFGSAKQLASYDGIAMVRRASECAAVCCGSRSVLVAGHEWRAVIAASAPVSGFVIRNDHYRDGIATSIAAGVRAVEHVADAVVVVLADQPLITSAHLAALIQAWSDDESDIVATSYAGISGVPALFARNCFSSLLELEGDRGARTLLDDARFEVRKIEFADAAVDVDTVEDLAKISRSAHN
ncbi:MAG: nucleotidyltransferase family protein [Woeseiaceae bacterium]